VSWWYVENLLANKIKLTESLGSVSTTTSCFPFRRTKRRYPASEILTTVKFRVARSLEIFSRTFCFSRDTVDYFHGCLKRGAKRVFFPLEIGSKNQKTLGNLKSASQFRLIDLILAITLNLPVWHSHCTKASFTVLVWCSDELAELHSCPFLRLQTHAAKLTSALF